MIETYVYFRHAVKGGMSVLAIAQHVGFRHDAVMPQTPGERLKALREAEVWSMDQLGARFRPPTTGSQINKLEKGKVKMTVEWLRRLAEALQVHYLEILEPAANLNPKERELVKLYRGLSEPDRTAVFRVVGAMERDTPHGSD